MTKKAILNYFLLVLFCTNLFGQTPFNNLQFLSGSTAGTELLNLASPGQVLSSNTSFTYNILNDLSGAKLITDNGDKKELVLMGSAVTGSLGNAVVTLSPTAASGRIRSNHGFSGTVTSNNPGSVNMNVYTLRFTSNITVTSASFNLSSLNTSGIAWEYSVIELLNENGIPFSGVSSPGWTIGANSQYNVGPVSGFSGMAGLGNFISASKLTVNGVGTSNTSTGVDGPNDNISNFTPATVGLPAGTIIGGIRVTTYLEDVRGTGNGATNFTASLLDFTISGLACPPVLASVPTLGEWGIIIFSLLLISISSIKVLHQKRRYKLQS